MKRANSTADLLFAAQLGLILTLGACTEKPQNAVAEAPAESAAPASALAPAMEQGMYFKPELNDFVLHNEYDDDGDGDKVKETHVRRYIDSKGNTAFSMSTNGTLWAWSLDTKQAALTDTRKNYVIRDSNCDGVFDERYSLTAQFHVPACTMEGVAAEKPGGT